MTAVAAETPRAHRRFHPAGAAAGAIRWSIGYREPAQPGRVHRGLPSPWLTMVFSLTEPFPIGVPRHGTVVEGSFRAPVGGLHTAAVLLPMGEAGVGVQLAVHPFAARALFGMPAGELSGQVLELSELLPPGRMGEADRLADLTGGRCPAGTAAQAIHRWIGGRLAEPTLPAPEVRRAWRLIIGSAGRLRVGTVAAEVGWSRRHLTDQLRIETGLAAKDLSRVARLDTASAAMQSQPRPVLADVAAACGYTDQAHLSTEWRELTGCTPTQWLATERY